MSDVSNMKPETIAAQGLGWIDETTRAVSPPIHVSSTYQRDPDNEYRSGRNYSRPDNPTYDQPEAVLASLEHGTAAMLFSSGMASATACFLALRPGDHVVISRVMYWSLRRWIVNFAKEWGLTADVVDLSDIDVMKRAMQPAKTKLVWAETPSNPLWEITDLAAAAEIAHAAGAKLAVDSTCATPVLTQPLDFGADIVMHSATKYLNGHSDLVMGALVTREKDEFWERLKTLRYQIGGRPGPFEAWLLLGGMRTLFSRGRAACAHW